MPVLIRHEDSRRPTNHISGLVLSLTQNGCEFFGYDAGFGPVRGDGVDADGKGGVEIGCEGAEEAEDGVFGGCWDW